MSAAPVPPARLPAPFGQAGKGFEVEGECEPEWTPIPSYKQARDGVPADRMSRAPPHFGADDDLAMRGSQFESRIPRPERFGGTSNGSLSHMHATAGSNESLLGPRFPDAHRQSSSNSAQQGRLSPPRRANGGSVTLEQGFNPTSASVASGASVASNPPVTGDPIHTALLRLADDFPIVNHFQRINYGFYRIENHGTCELSCARNSDKLFAKLDNWNRGVRGELMKFLQTITVGEDGPRRNSSEKNLHASTGSSGSGVRPGSPGAARGNQSSSSTFRPPERISFSKGGSPPESGASSPVANASTSSGMQRKLPAKKPGVSSSPAVPGAKPPMARSSLRRSQPTMGTPRGTQGGITGASNIAALSARCKEGALFVHAREPLFGDPMVLLRAADATSASGAGEDVRVLSRLLCSGRTAEVRATYIEPLELRPAVCSTASLAVFEELFLVGHAGDFDEASSSRNVFGRVELAELDCAQLEVELHECWPPDAVAPIRGLAWVLRPYFADWLKRRQRLNSFTQLAVALPVESLQRFSALANDLSQENSQPPSVESLLVDTSERDLLVATMLVTPPDQRARLYSLAADAAMPLPLAFPSLRSPCPPYDEPGSPVSRASVTEAVDRWDRGVVVHWDAFDALLARPTDRPLMLWVGAHGCSQSGKSSLLKELLGLEAAVVEGPGTKSTPARGATPLPPPCRSPAHTPGVDLLRSAAPLGWTADVHGCALGDPTWMALIAALAATASVIAIHISADDFNVEQEFRAPPPQQQPKQPSNAGRAPAARRNTTTGVATPAPAAAPPEPVGPPKITVKPDLLALMRLCADARLPGVGSLRTRTLVLLRDANASIVEQLLPGIRTCVEAVLGPSLVGICLVEKLTGITGGHRQRALASVRAQVERDLLSSSGNNAPAERPSSLGQSLVANASAGPMNCQFPSIDTLKRVFDHFYDRLTLAGERPVLASAEYMTHSRTGKVLVGLLDDAEAQAAGRLCATTFPVSEAAAQFARLKAQEKRLMENEQGTSPDDAQIAELSAKLRALERQRRTILSEPLSQPVHFFADVILKESRLRFSKIVEFGQYLAAWRNPRLTPLLERRRSLLDMRLQVGQDRSLEETAKVSQLATLASQLAEAEQALEQLNITLDGFWAELAAMCDLSAELQGLGIRPPPELPDAAQLKRQYGEWAWSLNQPLQLLSGSPLQCAGSFLVEVLKDLGVHDNRELFVISVIGIQSSAKSTLMNYLFGCAFLTSAGRCTRGLYCSLMETEDRTLLLLDTEGLMSLEAEGGDVFDAQLALMAMACSHLVLINHKGELSRQLQDLLEVCLFAMQHLKVTKLQPKLLFVLRDQHDRSHAVHGDALRLMRKHLAEASSHLSVRLDDLIALDPGSIFLLPSAFASDLDRHTGREVMWSTGLFAKEALKLRRKIFFTMNNNSSDGEGGAPEFSTLPDWCLHTMSVWRVLDRYGPNLLHYKTIQEIEVQRELEELVKQISAGLVQGEGGLAASGKALLADCSRRLSEGEQSEQVDAQFRSSLQALLDRAAKRGETELEQALQARKSKFPDARKDEARKKLQTPLEYQGELTRYTWTLCLTESVDRDQLKALKLHFKRTIEELWQAHSSQTLADEQARQIFASEWKAFEDKCRTRFDQTARSKKQLAEEVCLVFNHALRQHRHSDENLHVVELVPAAALLNEEPMTAWDSSIIAKTFLEVRNPQRLMDYSGGPALAMRGQTAGRRVASANAVGERLQALVVPEVKKHLGPMMNFEIPEGQTQVPAEEALLEAMRRLNEAVQNEEDRYLAQLGARFQGGRVAFLNAAHLCLRHSVLNGLVRAEEKRAEHQWRTLQSHRNRTEEEFLSMVQRHTSDAGRAKTLADLFFDALAREWLDETLVGVAADIRAQCLADMPDASGAAERAYQQAFVERNWEEVLEYVLDVNAYLHKIFSSLFEDRKASITRAQRPQLARQLGALFDSLTGAAQRWGHRNGGRRSKLSSFQATLQELAAEARASTAGDSKQLWPLLSERFPVVADFEVEDPARFAHELGLQVASRLGEAKVEGLVAERLEAALHKQQAQVWALIRGCSAMCPCCGSKCDIVASHTVHSCSHHLLPAFNGWRVAGTCEAALDACKSHKNHEAPKRSDYSEHLFPNLQEYLKAEHPEWLPFPREDRELLADSVLKAAWVNCRAPLLHRYDMVDSTPTEWIAAYEESHRKLKADAIDAAETRLEKYGYETEPRPPDAA